MKEYSEIGEKVQKVSSVGCVGNIPYQTQKTVSDHVSKHQEA